MNHPTPSLSQGDSRRPTREEVLAASIPGRPPRQVIPLEHDARDFDPKALWTAPEKGGHPRILFSMADVPAIRQGLAHTASGRATRAHVEAHLAPILEKGRWEQEAFGALAGGSVEAFTRFLADERNPRRIGPPGGGQNPILTHLMDRAFLTLIDGDEKGGRDIAMALSTYSRFLMPHLETALCKKGGEHFWLSARSVMGDGADLALAYDFARPFMTPAQSRPLVDLFLKAASGCYGLGMDLPAHFRHWNFIGMGLYFPLLVLAVEEEPGFDHRLVVRGAEVAEDYVRYGISAFGTGTEAVGYHTAGMSHHGLYSLALARRGINLFTAKRWRAMFENWMPWTQAPWGGQWFSSGDLGCFPPNGSLVKLARALYPEAPAVKDLVVHLPPRSAPDMRMDTHLLDLLYPIPDGAGAPLPVDRRRGSISPEKTLPSPMAPALHPKTGATAPLSQFDGERGIFWARTGWGREDLSLQVTARSDTFFPSHDFPDRGSFYLSALGEAWSVSGMRESESKYHSVITIDGRGQSYFPTPAAWVGSGDDGVTAHATVDTKYCYDWMWMKTSFLADDRQLADEPWLEVFRKERDRLTARFPLSQWERDPSPAVKAVFEKHLAGDPRLWGEEDTWVVRHPWYPVQKSFRSVHLVRGKTPFVLITDDIRKDDGEHLYQWRMTMPGDVEAYQIDGARMVLGRMGTKRKAVDTPDIPWKIFGSPIAEPGQSMLLVHVLECRQPDLPTLQDNMTLETVEYKKHSDEHQFSGRSMGMGKRLVIPSRSVEPGFKVLLMPFRQGEDLPEVTYDSKAGVATVTTGNESHKVTWRMTEGGRTEVKVGG